MNVFTQEIKKLLGHHLNLMWEKHPSKPVTYNLDLEASIEHALSTPPQPDMGDYAFPCFVMSKKITLTPAEIAKQLAESVAEQLAKSVADEELKPLIKKVQAQGAYLNIWVDKEIMVQESIPKALDGSLFKPKELEPQKIVVEYSQPNTHKGFHVGHMRNVALGDCLVRLLKQQGHEVIAASYYGDMGTHVARCLWMMKNCQELAPQLATKKPNPSYHMRSEWLGECYTAACQYLQQADSPEQQRCQQEIGKLLKDLEAGEASIRKNWKMTREWSLGSFREIYEWLDVRFDKEYYESDMGEEGKRLINKYLEEGKLIRSEGAIGIDLDEGSSQQKLGFLMFLKSDGNTLYATKDLALAKTKFNDYDMDISIYVVGDEQSFYFRQLFAAFLKLEISASPYDFSKRVPNVSQSIKRAIKYCTYDHLSYGLVTLPDGKMSSRAGNVVLFSKLRAAMTEYILRNYLDNRQGEWTEEEILETTRRISTAAIRYQMVKQDPLKPIVFRLDPWLVSEGDTGVYLCYAMVRMNSLLQKAAQKGIYPDPAADFQTLTDPLEHILIRHIHDLPSITHKAAERLKPSLLANAIFQFAKDFHRFYTVLPILRAEVPKLQTARLTLVKAARETLVHGLNLLGITSPERM